MQDLSVKSNHKHFKGHHDRFVKIFWHVSFRELPSESGCAVGCTTAHYHFSCVFDVFLPCERMLMIVACLPPTGSSHVDICVWWCTEHRCLCKVNYCPLSRQEPLHLWSDHMYAVNYISNPSLTGYFWGFNISITVSKNLSTLDKYSVKDTCGIYHLCHGLFANKSPRSHLLDLCACWFELKY